MEYNNFFMAIIFCIGLSSSTIFGMEQNNNDPYLLLSRAKNNNWGYVAQYLPEYDGDINATYENGYTLLHLAVLAEQIPCIELLIKKGAHNIENTCGPVSYNKPGKMWINRVETPLHYAAKKGNSKIIELLLDAGANINSTYNKFGSTPLHIATWFGHTDCVQLLIKRSAIIDNTNDHGSTPLHLAAWRNEPLCLEILLDNGSDFLKKSTTGEGNTPLYLAAKAGSLECLRILIKRYQTSGNKNALDEQCSGNNSTAIQVAGARQYAQCYWDLVAAGANYKKKTNKGENISEVINENKPLKNFIQDIEKLGPNHQWIMYEGNMTTCYLCNTHYKSNDVIIRLYCQDAFHVHCFEKYALECFISNNKNASGFKKIIQDNSPSEVIKILRTNPLIAINWNEIDTCPDCHSSIKINQSALSLH